MNCPLLQRSPWYCTLFLTAFLSGANGGGFLDSEVELAILPKSRSRSAFNLGGPAPNGRRDGESNGTTLDLVFTTAPSHGFRGADIP